MSTAKRRVKKVRRNQEIRIGRPLIVFRAQ